MGPRQYAPTKTNYILKFELPLGLTIVFNSAYWSNCCIIQHIIWISAFWFQVYVLHLPSVLLCQEVARTVSLITHVWGTLSA
jgi:hypothetical protein